MRVASGALALTLYRRLPEETRRCLRPLNLVDEAASFLPAPARAPITTSTEVARRLLALRRVRYRIRRLEGFAAGDRAPLVCVLALDEISARYWTRTLFAAPPREQTLGDVRPPEVRRTAERVAEIADLSLWQLPWPLSRLADGEPLVPSSVPLWLDTSRPLEAIVVGEPRGRGSRKDDARRVRRLALSVRLGTGKDVDRFRRELYEPYGARRFGDLFNRVPAHVFRHAGRAGWLLLLEDRGRTVAGALLERWARDVRILAFGVALDAGIPSGLLLEACYFHSIRFAVERKIPRLSLGTVRPVLSDGVLRYKRKWGGVLGRPSTWEAYLLRYRNTPATREALAAAPVVVDRGGRGLAALVGVRSGDVPADVARVETPGLVETACLTDRPVTLAATGAATAVRVVPAPTVWPREAAAGGSRPLVPEAVPVGDVLGGPAAPDAERPARSAHRD